MNDRRVMIALAVAGVVLLVGSGVGSLVGGHLVMVLSFAAGGAGWVLLCVSQALRMFAARRAQAAGTPEA